MRKLTQSQKDFLIICIVGFLLYEWLVRYEIIHSIITFITEKNMYSLIAFVFVFFMAFSIYSFRRWKSQARLNEKWQQISLLDELTGLYNRRGFLKLSTQRLRRSKTDLYLLYADLDNMKWINDQLGHQTGDHALIKTAYLLQASFSTSVVIARLGGDEFALLVEGVPRKLVERMIRDFEYQVEQFNESNQRSYFLSISMGVAHYTPKFPMSLAELMTEADRAMYEQKMKNKEVLQESNAQL
jgi:diguanylate cyclase (GGDEF)-like protein